ncbi:MAG: hypothetical protein ABFC74_01485, partial [Rectinema sp.]
MQIKHPEPYAKGYELLVSRDGPNADMLMDYAHLSIQAGESWRSSSAHERKGAEGSGERTKNDGPSINDERAFLLARGTVEFTWKLEGSSQPGGNNAQGEAHLGRATASRSNLFDESPAVLSVPAGVEVEIRALPDNGNRHGDG